MTKSDNGDKPAHPARKDVREARLAAQLRANLKRRKIGARGQEIAQATAGAVKSADEPQT